MAIQRPSNCYDQSSNEGFQFGFHCQRCGLTRETTFSPCTASGVLDGALDAASGLLGSFLGGIGEKARSVVWEQSHDRALNEAVQEMGAFFVQCPHCAAWVCRASCWNERRGLCKSCAPDMGVTMAAAQAEKTTQAIREGAEVAPEDVVSAGAWKDSRRATCGKCGAVLSGKGKFCEECGAPTTRPTTCPACRAPLGPDTKFCGECGNKI